MILMEKWYEEWKRYKKTKLRIIYKKKIVRKTYVYYVLHIYL